MSALASPTIKSILEDLRELLAVDIDLAIASALVGLAYDEEAGEPGRGILPPIVDLADQLQVTVPEASAALRRLMDDRRQLLHFGHKATFELDLLAIQRALEAARRPPTLPPIRRHSVEPQDAGETE